MIAFPDAKGAEQRIPIESIDSIYEFKKELLDSIEKGNKVKSNIYKIRNLNNA